MKRTLNKIDCRKVCYAQLIGHCTKCPKCTLACATKHAQYIRDLSDRDKLVLEAIMGDQEEFDDGTAANEMLRNYFIGRVKVTLEWLDTKTADGKRHTEHLLGARYKGSPE